VRVNSPFFLPRDCLQRLPDVLADRGFRVLGPQVRDGAIVFGPLESVARLPVGIVDEQAAGSYRLRHTSSPRCFSWTTGPQAIKPWVFAPREELWTARPDEGGRLVYEECRPEPVRQALIGVRACDLAALELQDRHFLRSGFTDPHYQARRQGLFLVALNCGRSSPTCFCASTGDGPGVSGGYDLLMGELDEGYVIEAGTAPGSRILAELGLAGATPQQVDAVRREVRAARESQSRHLPAGSLKYSLNAHLDSPRWDEIGKRCLACGNCTAVCPTCFCHSEQERVPLDGSSSTHFRQWDSCFSDGHSYMHGFTIRPDARSRYRQWMIHKLASWHDQYGRSGCVGCGRCISWCPVGIDLTAEVVSVLGRMSASSAAEEGGQA